MQILKDYLAVTGISANELARRAKIDPPALNHILNGRHEPRIKYLRRLSEATGISVGRLAESLAAQIKDGAA